jgi:DNA-directed RNA polymerase subunit RPC12/RpoP
MVTEKFYCGNCGSPLYFGRKFKEHSLGRECPTCRHLNPLYFRYCYRCGVKLIPSEEETEDETL